MPLPGERIEAITGEELAVDLAALSGRDVNEIKTEGVQTTLVAMRMMGQTPAVRQGLQRLASDCECCSATC